MHQRHEMQLPRKTKEARGAGIECIRQKVIGNETGELQELYHIGLYIS